MSQPRFDLVIFDWDGTLMDSAPRIVDSFETAIAELGLPPLDPASIRDIIGLGLVEAIRSLYPQQDAATQEALRQGYRRHYQRSEHATPLFEGAAELLHRLHASGYRLAVATGKGRAGLNHSLADTGLESLFSATRCAEETRSKPDPLMLHEIMRQLDADPARTLMVGDTEYDLCMARQAGAASAGVLHGVHPRERLQACQPLACFDDLGELGRWFSALQAWREQG